MIHRGSRSLGTGWIESQQTVVPTQPVERGEVMRRSQKCHNRQKLHWTALGLVAIQHVLADMTQQDGLVVA